MNLAVVLKYLPFLCLARISCCSFLRLPLDYPPADEKFSVHLILVYIMIRSVEHLLIIILSNVLLLY